MSRFDRNPFDPETAIFHEVIRDFTTMAPTVRLVVVHAQAWLDETTGRYAVKSGLTPVVAVRSKLVDIYDYTPSERPEGSKRSDENEGPDRSSPDHSHLLVCGWEYVGRVIQDEFLVLDEYGLLLDTNHVFQGRGFAHEVVACTWSQDLDYENLEKIQRKLSEEARQHV